MTESAARRRAVLFDLDDTLYDEREYVRSGLRAAAAYAARHWAVSEAPFYQLMLRELEARGRGRVFDAALESAGALSPGRVGVLVEQYRAHVPSIRLFDESAPVLRTLRERGFLLALITDGLARMQRAKIGALDVEPLLDLVLCTDELAPGCAKPSPEAYRRALGALQVNAGDAAMVGDDESRDFKAANDLGMLTIRVRPPAWGLAASRPAPDPSFRARLDVDSVAAVPAMLERP